MENDHVFIGANGLVALLIIAVALAIGHVIKVRQWSYIPESVAVMVLGFIVGIIVWAVGRQESAFAMFSPELFFYGLLPPIVFHAGYSMKKARFFRNMGSIVVYAVLGTLVSALFIGYPLYGLAKAGAVPLDSNSPIEALTYGSLLSAVDPIATLAILGASHLHADPLLHSLIFGESILNDVVSIVLYNSLRGYQSKPFKDSSVFEAAGLFLGVSLGSLVIGVVLALACALLLKRAKFSQSSHGAALEVTIVIFTGYSAYCLPEILQLSGIMSIFFCGILCAHYASYNLSEVAKTSVHTFLSMAALVCETFLFAYLGITAVLSFRPMFHLSWSLSLIITTLVLCMLSRALNIFPFSYLLNLGRKEKITRKIQIAMWFAGPRGAIAFALALNMNSAHRDVIVTSTMSCVIITTVLLGGLTAPLLTRLGLTSHPGSPVTSTQDTSAVPLMHSASSAGSHSSNPTAGRPNDDQHQNLPSPVLQNPSRVHRFWINFDENFMKPMFGGRKRGATSMSRTGNQHVEMSESGESKALLSSAAAVAAENDAYVAISADTSASLSSSSSSNDMDGPLPLKLSSKSGSNKSMMMVSNSDSVDDGLQEIRLSNNNKDSTGSSDDSSQQGRSSRSNSGASLLPLLGGNKSGLMLEGTNE